MKSIVRFLVVTAATVIATTSSARAQCVDPSETFVTTVTRTFSSGSSFSIGVSRRTCEGLAIGAVTFKPAGGTPRKVLARATIAEVHVPYHTGSPRYHDATSGTAGLGANAIPLAAAECGGRLFDGNRICVRNADGGYGWKYGTSFRRAQAIEIFMSSQVGQYNYINLWRFHDDGVIEPEVGLTGQLQSYGDGAAYLPYGRSVNPAGAAPLVAKAHMHNFYYRLDFDIGGGANDAISRVAFHPSTAPSPDSNCATVGECGTSTETPIPVERAETFSPEEQTSWIVFDKLLTNADGRRIGYEILPRITGLWRGMASTTEPWSNADLWVTRYDKCERYAVENAPPFLDANCGTPAANVAAMVNGGSVDGADLVVWYVNRVQHVPRDEDEEKMPIEWTGFSIVPRSFSAQNPSP
jgi:primary-amine oxidase